MEDYNEQTLREAIAPMDGNDSVVIYISTEKKINRLGPSFGVLASKENVEALQKLFGDENVKVVEKKVEFARGKRNF